jgi:FixJ family two-component response regulator
MNANTIAVIPSMTCPRPTAPMVFVVHGDSSVRTTLGSLIRGAQWQPRMFADAEALLAQLHAAGPACLILDMNLADIDGLELQSQLIDRREIPVIFIAENPSVRTIVRAMKAGAIEVLTKPLDERLLLDAIRQALQLSSTIQRQAAGHLALQRKYALLSRREREVMRYVVRGELNKNIAADLGISEITVKVHRGQVMRKMQASSLPDLVNMAATLRILTADPPLGEGFATPAPSFTYYAHELENNHVR